MQKLRHAALLRFVAGLNAFLPHTGFFVWASRRAFVTAGLSCAESLVRVACANARLLVSSGPWQGMAYRNAMSGWSRGAISGGMHSLISHDAFVNFMA